MSGSSSSTAPQKKYKGVRRRKWGKWVSEIRVPGTQERLWLGSYSSAEAAAVAHDIASYCLRGAEESLNFPNLTLPASVRRVDMSPRSVQKAASDAGMAVDAQMIMQKLVEPSSANSELNNGNGRGGLASTTAEQLEWGDVGSDENCRESLTISVDDYF